MSMNYVGNDITRSILIDQAGTNLNVKDVNSKPTLIIKPALTDDFNVNFFTETTILPSHNEIIIDHNISPPDYLNINGFYISGSANAIFTLYLDDLTKPFLKGFFIANQSALVLTFPNKKITQHLRVELQNTSEYSATYWGNIFNNK